MEGVWGDILHAGIIIAELSTPNPNVFYELGLVHALGKDTVILKEKSVKLPADFLGTLYVEYVASDKQKALKDVLDGIVGVDQRIQPSCWRRPKGNWNEFDLPGTT